MDKLLSYIVPVYNSAKYLPRCLDSFYLQEISESDFEVIIINDGSPDNAEEVCDTYIKAHDNIIYVKQKNQGQGSARNKGLNLAKGKYVMFVDSDDFLYSHKVKEVLEQAMNKNTDILRFRIDGEEKNGSIAVEEFGCTCSGMVESGEELLLRGLNMGSACNSIFSRDFLINYSFKFRTDIIHEDVAFNYSIYPYAKRVFLLDRRVYLYKYNENSTDRSLSKERRLKFVESDIRIAAMLKNRSQNKSISPKLKNYYRQTSNSMIISSFLQSFSNKSPFNRKTDFFSLIAKNGLYPVKGNSRSWKTFLLIPVINITYLFIRHLL